MNAHNQYTRILPHFHSDSIWWTPIQSLTPITVKLQYTKAAERNTFLEFCVAVYFRLPLYEFKCPSIPITTTTFFIVISACCHYNSINHVDHFWYLDSRHWKWIVWCCKLGFQLCEKRWTKVSLAISILLRIIHSGGKRVENSCFLETLDVSSLDIDRQFLFTKMES